MEIRSVEAQPVMISFRVDDVAAAVAASTDRGVASYPDPEGTWYQLSQPRDG